MGMFNAAPAEPRTRMQNWPTLLFSWWCTIFAAVIIITRLCGRKVRSNVLFREDWIMMATMVPLFIRMGIIHIVLIYGTNNVRTVGVDFTEVQLMHRETGAKFVLAARIFYAATIWMSKLTVSEFLKRITIRIWRRSYEMTLQGIRVFLGLTFIAVVIATLAECQPFDHYWQIIPDPGPACRDGFAQLLTMGVCDIVTDILLVAFPIPIVIRSGQSWKRKLQLTSLFSLSVIMIAVTATRMPMIVFHKSRQQYRTVWASCEILASISVSNAVILGSFLRDKGTKKNKFRSHSVTDSIDRSSVRRPTITALQRVGSDEDLFRYLGCRVPDHLLDHEESTPRPAPAAPSARAMSVGGSRKPPAMPKLQTYHELSQPDVETDVSPRGEVPPLPSPAPSTKRSVSFFDVGGLLDDGTRSWDTRSRSTTIVDSGTSGTVAQDFATPSPQQSRRGSRALISDLGGILSPTASRNGHGNGNGHGRRNSDAQHSQQRHRGAPIGILGPMLERHETQQSLQDAGGLLGGSQLGLRHALESSRLSHHTLGALARPPSQHSLQDIGGILSEGHVEDASASALRRVTDRSGTGRSTRHNASSSRNQQPDDMSLHDPGGLLSNGS